MNLLKRGWKKIKRANIPTFKNQYGEKIFCIGDNKTGTTSLKKAMISLGFTVGNQGKAEKMVHLWAKRDFSKIIEYCNTAQFFQDIPFSKPYTYIALDQAFPNSKYILTVRDNEEQWYKSLTKFHSKKWGKNGRVPTKEDLKNAVYHYKGRPWDANRFFYTTPEDNPYEKEELIKRHRQHNENVIEYFRHRPQDLLILNVASENAYNKLCDFLGVETDETDFPWENKTINTK